MYQKNHEKNRSISWMIISSSNSSKRSLSCVFAALINLHISGYVTINMMHICIKRSTLYHSLYGASTNHFNNIQFTTNTRLGEFGLNILHLMKPWEKIQVYHFGIPVFLLFSQNHDNLSIHLRIDHDVLEDSFIESSVTVIGLNDCIEEVRISCQRI